MWDVENRTWFPHHAGFARDHAARTFWIVTIKARFTIRPGQPCLLAEDQHPPSPGPRMVNDVLLDDAEVTLPRALCDLLIRARVSASDAPRPLTARLGSWDKTLWLHPMRLREGSGRLRFDPRRTGELDLDAALTFGGPDHPENAAGCGLSAGPDGLTPLPGLRDTPRPDFDATTERPCGFGPVPRDAASRQLYAGRYDDDWLRLRAPLLPADLDPRFWQSAPEDQRLDPDAVAGETLILTGFGAGDIAIPVPAPDFEIATRIAGRWHPHSARLQSVTADLIENRLTMLWQAALAIGPVQNDVLVERSSILLRHARGFSVTPAMAASLGNHSIQESA